MQRELCESRYQAITRSAFKEKGILLLNDAQRHNGKSEMDSHAHARAAAALYPSQTKRQLVREMEF